MKDARRIAAIACVMLVTLRLMIGWQLLYEGLWKIKTLKSPTPWTAAGYLKNSQGPFRAMFRNMAGDPDDLDWLDVKKVASRWSDWQNRFAKHYRLSKGQKAKLDKWVNGSKAYKAEVSQIPQGYNNVVFEFELPKEVKNSYELSGTDAKGNTLAYQAGRVKILVDGKGFRDFTAADGSTITLNPKADKPLNKGAKVQVLAGERLMALGLDESVSFESGEKDYVVVDGRRHLTPAEREKLIAALNEDGHSELIEAVQQVYKRAKDGISFKERLSATIKGNPDWVSNKKLQRVGEIEKYRSLLADYEEKLASANLDYRWDHLQHTWSEIQALRSSLVGPVKALDTELKDKAAEMLSVKQLARGPVPEPWTSLRISDLMTIAGLTILGACLILGVFTRFSAITAAFMLFMFYAAMPPWPGVPEAPGPEHSFIVNKNFIEVVALLALACLPTGRWFGVDGMIGRWLGKRKLSRLDAAP